MNKNLITQSEFEAVLLHEGIIQKSAVEDHEGYDNGKTKLAISTARQHLNSIIREKTIPPELVTNLIRELESCLMIPANVLPPLNAICEYYRPPQNNMKEHETRNV